MTDAKVQQQQQQQPSSRQPQPVPNIIVGSPKVDTDSSDPRKPDSSKFRRPSLKLLPPSSAVELHSDLESITSENEGAEGTTDKYR